MKYSKSGRSLTICGTMHYMPSWQIFTHPVAGNLLSAAI